VLDLGPAVKVVGLGLVEVGARLQVIGVRATSQAAYQASQG